MRSKRLGMFRILSLAAVVTAGLFATAVDRAMACACCTNPGQRRVEAATIDSGIRAQIEEIRFAGTAQLFVGEADVDDVKGITTPSGTYEMKASWENARLVLAFRDTAGREGTLSLPRPRSVSIFEIDPRTGDPDQGTGPTLYKEWKLTAKPSGTGIFSAGLGPQQFLTLIMQGRGNSCTSSTDFTHWTLVMQGPKGKYTLFGDLAR